MHKSDRSGECEAEPDSCIGHPPSRDLTDSHTMWDNPRTIMDPHIITPILFAALIAWGIYRRMRRTFGRQRIDVNRIRVRIAIFAIIGALAVAGTVHGARTVGGLLAGIACGSALATIGLRHTKFEATPESSFYTPHTYIGVAVAALFLARLLYRVLYLPYMAHATTAASPNLALAYQQGPLTMGMFGALVGYYVVFYLGVLLRSRTPALSVQANPTD